MSHGRFFPIIALILCLGFSPKAAFAAQLFSDVGPNQTHSTAIQSLADLGVINGYSDGSFRPQDPITRAEAAKILIGAIKPSWAIEEVQNSLFNGESYSPFVDVPADDWFSPYVYLAFQGEITMGYEDGSFRPGNNITAAEGLKMILSAYGMDITRTRYIENPLLLANPDDWFARYFQFALNHNLINREKFYYPAQKMTRGEFAEILYRTKTVREAGEDQFFSDAVSNSNEYTITIPKLNIINVDVSFADPFDSKGSLGLLVGGMGHYLSPPGGGHKMVLFGHSSGYSWDRSPYKTILTQIDRLEIGDRIYINYHEKGYIYEISNKEIRFANDMQSVMDDYGYEEMALYTCWPPNGITKRYVVYATPIFNP